MRFSVLALSTLALLSPAFATDVIWYRGSSNCGGSVYYTTYNIGERVCYTWPSGTGITITSAKFQSLPSGAKAQVYTSYGTCADYGGETTTSGGCISNPSIAAGNWFYPWKRLSRKRETDAQTRHGVTYELPDGTVREVEVSLQQLDKTLLLVDENDYESLAKLPDFVHDN